MKGVYEALMEYAAVNGACGGDEQMAVALTGLFERHQELAALVKVIRI